MGHKVLIEIRLDMEPRLRELVYASIVLEDIDREYVTIVKDPLTIRVQAETLSRARAILNSYISWVYTVLSVVENIEEMKSGRKDFT